MKLVMRMVLKDILRNSEKMSRFSISECSAGIDEKREKGKRVKKKRSSGMLGGGGARIQGQKKRGETRLRAEKCISFQTLNLLRK